MLTRKQKKLLIFVHNFIQTNGIAPSFEEMHKALDLKSRSGVHRMLGCLEERGFVRRIPNRSRAIEVIKLPQDFTSGDQFAGMRIVANPAVPEGEIWVTANWNSRVPVHKFVVGA